MKLIFISQANLRDKKFVIDLIHNFKQGEKAIILHDHFGVHFEDTRFVTKRLSALLSENGIVNIAFSGDQRNIFKKDDSGLNFREDFVLELMQNVQVFILNPIIANGKGSREAEASELILRMRSDLEIDEVIVFPKNPLSPLGAERKAILSDEELEKLLGVYEEEKPALEFARELRPVTIASPVNFMA